MIYFCLERTIHLNIILAGSTPERCKLVEVSKCKQYDNETHEEDDYCRFPEPAIFLDRTEH